MENEGKAQFVVCFATADDVVANLHAYCRGEGSLRDEQHVGEIARTFARENAEIICNPPDGKRVLFEAWFCIDNTRHGTSRYYGWDFKMHEGCPHDVATAGMDIYLDIKRVIRRARKTALAEVKGKKKGKTK